MVNRHTFTAPCARPPWVKKDVGHIKHSPQLNVQSFEQESGNPGFQSSAIPPMTADLGNLRASSAAIPSKGNLGHESAAIPVSHGGAEWQHAAIMELMSDCRGETTVHSQLEAQWTARHSRIKQPPPREVEKLLREAKEAGTDIDELLHNVAMSRVARSVRDTSFTSYSSHLNCICMVCELLAEEVVPCRLQTIRKYIAICNIPVTLRGHLAAWRLLHLVSGHEWSGDKDPFTRAVQAGMLRTMPPPKPKLAIRMGLALRIVEHCFQSGDPLHAIFGIMVSMSYVFALRVPSELLKQASPRLLKVSPEKVLYGPIWRKGCSEQAVLQRTCLCQAPLPPTLRAFLDSVPAGCGPCPKNVQ